MFGRTARTLADQVICACNCGSHEANRGVEAFSINTAATLKTLTEPGHVATNAAPYSQPGGLLEKVQRFCKRRLVFVAAVRARETMSETEPMSYNLDATPLTSTGEQKRHILQVGSRITGK